MSDTESFLDSAKAERLSDWMRGTEAGPFSLEISPTMACNVNCRFCRRQDELEDYYAKTRDLPDDRWYEIVAEAARMGTKRILFRGGGDPSLKRRLLARIMPLIPEHGLHCTLLTNGTLIDDVLAEGMARWGWGEVTLSLHGGDAETHDYITDHPGSFERVLGSLEALRRHRNGRPIVTFHVVLTRRSFGGLDKIIALARDYGAAHVGVFPMHNPPYPQHVTDLEMRPEDRRLYRELVPRYKESLDAAGIGYDFEMSYQGTGPEDVATPSNGPPPSTAPLPWGRVPCYFPWYHATITPWGTLSPCCYGEGHQTKGRLDRVGFREAWLGHDMGEIRESFRRGSLRDYCAKCPNWYQADNRRLRAIVEGGEA